MRAAPRPGWLAPLAACIAVAGLVSLALGQDANWDLRNYHFYVAHAVLHGRLGWDLAPAQIQTFLNPLADLPFHAALELLPDPRAVAFAMAAPAGIAAFLVLRMLALLFTPATPHRLLCILAAALIGLTGASGIAMVGSTMNEWLCTAFTLGGVYVALRSVLQSPRAPWRAFALAGLLAGCAMGLKLTYGPYALGLVAGLACCGEVRTRAPRCLAASLAVLLGFLLTYGWWGATLQERFGSPFFPFFNAFFLSPWYEPANWFDHGFGPRDALQALAFPLWFARESALVSQVAFRDYRLAAVLVLGLLACLAAWRRRRATPHVKDRQADAWIFLAAFTAASYVLWQGLFAIHRYLLPLEAISGALIVGSLVYLLRRGGARRVAIVGLALLLVGTTRKPGWERVPFGERYFEVSVPSTPPGSLVILGFNVPGSYAIAFFPADARFVSPANNFLSPGQRNLLARGIAGAIEGHGGPLYSLEERVPRAPGTDVPRAFGLARTSAGCTVIRSNLELERDALQLCPLERIRPRVTSSR